MELTIKLFGPQALLAGSRACRVTMPGDEASVTEVLAAVARTVRPLADSIAHSRLAVNHEVADTNQLVKEGDELALLGMMNGG